jgi:putative peptidoglycan lipid II flippase
VRARISALINREFGVAHASILLLGAYLGSAVLGATRQILLSARFGGGDDLSAYIAASRLPDTLFTLVAGGALTNAMVPVLVAARKGEGSSLQRIVELTLTALMLAIAALSAIGVILAPWIVRSVIAPGFDEPTSALTTNLTRLLFLQPLILAVASVSTAVLNSRARFFLPALAILVQNVSDISGILLSWAIKPIGVYGPALGVIGGVALQAIVLLPALRMDGKWPRFAWDPQDAQLRTIVALLIPNALLIGSSYFGGVVETAFASLDANDSAIPALSNAWLLVGLPVRLIGVAVGQAAFPRLAADASSGDWRAFKPRLWKTFAAVFALTAAGIPFFLLLGRGMVTLLYEHGEYTRADGDLTYTIVFAFLWGLPFYAVTEVLTRGLLALHDTRSPLFTNLTQLVLRALAMWLLIDPWGLTVIPWSQSISAPIETLVLAYILTRRIRQAAREVV